MMEETSPLLSFKKYKNKNNISIDSNQESKLENIDNRIF